jgi:hypothetical protein
MTSEVIALPTSLRHTGAMRNYLVINVVAFAAFGLAGLLFPVAFAGVIGYQAAPSALTDFSGMYGGLSLALSALILAGVRRAADARSAVVLTVVVTAGLHAGRLLGAARFGGLCHWFNATSAALELTSIALGLWLLRVPREATG